MADDVPDGFDPIYFAHEPWDQRVAEWVRARGRTFSDVNLRIVSQAIRDPDAGLRAVVNIGVSALLSVLKSGRYRNLYETPVIGGKPRTVPATRREVDEAMDLIGARTYFAAVALGGAGVRYYGEYCLVLDLDAIDANPRLFDRDSYDILLPPIGDLEHRDELISHLRGRWPDDVYAMVLMKVLPDVLQDRQLVTTGTVSDLVLKDQEFIEIHLCPAADEAGQPRSFGPPEIEELRESPDEVAVATRLREREEDGLRLSDVEHEWLLRREAAMRELGRAGIRTRVVTQHGRGYQWK
jgi:hypothetical protein